MSDAPRSADTSSPNVGRRNDDRSPLITGVPPWVLTMLQMAVPAAFAIAVMYVKVNMNEKETDRLMLKVDKIEDKVLINESRISLSDANSGSLQRALERIESDLREVKSDVKQLSRERVAAPK